VFSITTPAIWKQETEHLPARKSPPCSSAWRNHPENGASPSLLVAPSRSLLVTDHTAGHVPSSFDVGSSKLNVRCSSVGSIHRSAQAGWRWKPKVHHPGFQLCHLKGKQGKTGTTHLLQRCVVPVSPFVHIYKGSGEMAKSPRIAHFTHPPYVARPSPATRQ
jgi:hypothetical protein